MTNETIDPSLHRSRPQPPPRRGGSRKPPPPPPPSGPGDEPPEGDEPAGSGSLAQIAARAALNETNDVAMAAKLLEVRAKKDPVLFRALTEPTLASICYDMVRGESQQQRRVAWTAPNYDAGGGGDRVLAHAEKTLLDFRLPNGMLLRDAKRADLMAAAQFYRAQALDMAHKAAWLDRVAEAVGNKAVGKALNADQLAQLREAVRP